MVFALVFQTTYHPGESRVIIIIVPRYIFQSALSNNSKCGASVHLLMRRSVARRRVYVGSREKKRKKHRIIKYAAEYNSIEKVMISVTSACRKLPLALYHLLTILKPTRPFPPFFHSQKNARPSKKDVE